LEQTIKEAKSTPSTGLYTFEGGATALLPVYVFIFIKHVDLESNIIIMGVFSVLAAYLLSQSYEKLALEYRGQFEKELGTAVKASAKAKGVSKDKLADHVRKVTVSAADEQASALSILYNNAIFLAVFLFLAFFMFKNLNLSLNFALAVTISSAIPFIMSS